ncbi:MAG: hypothetical protein HYS20_14720 [Rhodocyclales bacterium]|nr:hypothetical protein [Rhodocyclales bacterium]
MSPFSRRYALFALAAAPVVLMAAARGETHGGAPQASAASSLSLSLPVAFLVAAPVGFLAGGVTLTVMSVDASARGIVAVVRRASDGVEASLEFSGDVGVSALFGVAAVISVTTVVAGWLLSVAGEVICIVPNALGEALLHNEKVR